MTIYQEINYYGQIVKVAKLKKSDFFIQGSVDGKKYGTSGDLRLPKDFGHSFKDYTPSIICNGGIFYTFEGAGYTEGLEISLGINNQDFSMNAVSRFKNSMAVGFTKDGCIIFDKQENIMAEYYLYYGAVTFAFGIMKDGNKVSWGQKEQSDEYNCVSGRTILGQNDDYVFVLGIEGETGKTGLKGSVLYDLCRRFSMKDAGCFDGGGSVFLKVNGKFKINTSRKVKNAVILFTNYKWKPEEPEEGEGMFYLEVARGTYRTGGMSAIPTRETPTGTYDLRYPLYVGEVIGVTGDPISSKGEPVYKIATGAMAGRYVLLEREDMKAGYFVPVIKP